MSTAATPGAATSTWKIDPVHSNAQFKVKHMMISHVKGEFTSINGTLELDESDISRSRVEASIDATTINTREAQRDAHLKSADFLDVEKFPTLKFKSTRIAKKGDDEYAVSGDLSIHGVTRNVTLQVEELSARRRTLGEILGSAFRPMSKSIARTSAWSGTQLLRQAASSSARKSPS